MAGRLAFLAGLTFLVLAVPVRAQDAVVRSGEHAGFTRIVVDLPARVDWSVGGQGSRREIVLQDFGGRLDFSRVYDRLSSGRVARIEALSTAKGLALDMNCACDVALSWLDPGMLVVDIRGEVVLPYERPAKGNPDEARTSLDLPLVETKVPGRIAGALAETQLTPLLHAGPSASEVSAPNIETARASLAREITTAASMGLLSVVSDEPASLSDPVSAPDGRPQSAIAAPRNFATQNAAEVISGRASHVQTANGVSCLADALIDLPSWGNDAPFGHQLSDARAGLMGEFDRLSEEAAIRTARLYLYFGLGLEAAQMIDFAGIVGEDARLIRAMADILEEKPQPDGAFSGQIGCETAAALWAALGQPPASREMPNVDAMLKTLSAYPVRLRDLLGPRLAAVLTARGRPKDAARVLRLVERGQTSASGARMLAQARTEAALGETGAASETLNEAMTDGSLYSAEAAVETVWIHLEAGQPIEPPLVDLIESYAREQNGTELGDRLQGAYIVALAATGQHDDAIKALFADSNGPRLVLQDRVFSDVALDLAKSASDVTFLKHALGRGVTDWMRASPEARLALGQRLIELGFADAAAPYIAASRTAGSQSQIQLSAADAELGQSRPESALRALAGLSGVEADLRRAKALAMTGNHRAAHLAYLAAGRPDEAAREALLFEPRGGANEATAAVPPDSQESLPGQLGQSASLIEQSETTRTEIEAMLEAIGQNSAPLGQ